MDKHFLWGALAATALGCGSPPPKEDLPDRSTPAVRRVKPDEVLALVNGEPVTWQDVAEKVLELNLKESVDQYIRWRIVENRKSELGIEHTPEELRRRSILYLEQVKRQVGPERFRQELAREGSTEAAKQEQVAGSRFLDQLFTLDKIVRFAALLEDQIQIDRVFFTEEAAARRFGEAVAAKGFEEAAQAMAQDRKASQGRLPREVFPKSQPPRDPALDPRILEAVLRLSPGSTTGVELSRSNLYYVVRLVGIRKGRNVVYSDVREEVLESIFKDPPTQQEYARWMEGETAHCRVEYLEGGARRERPRGSP